MLILQQFDWFGTEKELEDYEATWKKACEETDGIEFKGRYTPHTRRYHYTFLFKCDSYDKANMAGSKVTFPQRSKVPSIVNELYY